MSLLGAPKPEVAAVVGRIAASAVGGADAAIVEGPRAATQHLGAT